MRDRLMRYLIAQAAEPSTWRGLVLIATACGAVLTPEQREAIIVAGLGVAGAIGALAPDAKKPPPGRG